MSTPAVGRLFAASIAPATHRAYRGALARLAAWCSPGATLDDETLATYLGALDQAGKSPAVAEQVIAAVRFQARLTGVPTPVGPLTERALVGFRRQGAGRGRGPVWPGCAMRRCWPWRAMRCCAPARSPGLTWPTSTTPSTL